MSCVAFVYRDYDRNGGVMDTFSGIYSDAEDARNALKGDRYDRANLEIMDLETCGFTRWRWTPLYVIEATRDAAGNRVEALAHRWDKDKPNIPQIWADNRLIDSVKIFYEAGEWESLDRHQQSMAHAEYVAKERRAAAVATT